MNKILLKLASLLAVLTLAACGGTDTQDNTNTGTLNVDAYQVTGSAGNDTDGTALLSPSISNGDFTVHWKVSGLDSYHARLYLSKDDQLDRNYIEDQSIYTKNCGSTLFSSCGHDVTMTCRWDTNMVLWCDQDRFNPPINFSTYFTALPADYYLILDICPPTFKGCKATAYPIRFF